MSTVLLAGQRLRDFASQLPARLSAEDFRVEWVPSIEAAQRFLDDEWPAFIILEKSLDGIGVEAFITHLKNNPDSRQTNLLVVAAPPSPPLDSVAILSAGADDIITQLEDIGQIEARLRVISRFRRSVRNAEELAEQLTQLNAELYERNLAVEKELYVARQLQESLLPPFLSDEQNPDSLTNSASNGEMDELDAAAARPFQFSRCHHRSDSLRISGLYLPCDALGGDLYDVLTFQDQSVGVAVADVSGHGVPAAFITAIFKASFYRMTLTYDRPNDILYHLNNELANIVKTGDYVTGIYCRISPDGRNLEYSGAGHPYPILYSAATGSLSRLSENGTPLVWIPDMPYPNGAISLAPGDKVLIFTDGISEIINMNGEIFGEERLEALFLDTLKIAYGGEILDRMLQQLSDYTEGHPLQDDMSMVVIEAL
jgi:serine phosphatase RsbU (regulator of sigma subunit)